MTAAPLPGGRQVCFQLLRADTKYRLGNDCHTYSELGLSQALHQWEGGEKAPPVRQRRLQRLPARFHRRTAGGVLVVNPKQN